MKSTTQESLYSREIKPKTKLRVNCI